MPAAQGCSRRLLATLLDRPRWIYMAHIQVMDLSAEQFRDRAKFLRYTAEAVRSALLRDDLLEIARKFDERAEALDRSDRSSIR